MIIMVRIWTVGPRAAGVTTVLTVSMSDQHQTIIVIILATPQKPELYGSMILSDGSHTLEHFPLPKLIVCCMEGPRQPPRRQHSESMGTIRCERICSSISRLSQHRRTRCFGMDQQAGRSDWTKSNISTLHRRVSTRKRQTVPYPNHGWRQPP